MRVSDDKCYLLDDQGQPFFYLADTAWRFFYDTTHQEADRYMRKRKEQGFTLFMPVILSEVNPDESDANQFGELALMDWDPARPNEKFFQYVDWTMDRAREIGLVVGLLPTWGEFVGEQRWGKGPRCFHTENAYAYGEFLGRRYRDAPNLIWVLGGDRNPYTQELVSIWRSMARGIRRGDGGKHLITYHPAPEPEVDQFSCSHWLPDEDWLDFYMLQTGTKIDRPNYNYIYRDYVKTGARKKPTLDGECRYEHSHERFNQFPQVNLPFGRRIGAHQVRKAAYNAMLSGAAGHTYGCRCVWNFYREGTLKTRDTDMDWRLAMDLPGAWQMGHMRSLLTKYPFHKLVPDFEGKLITYGNGTDGAYIAAAISRDRDFALAYVPEAMPFKANLNVVEGRKHVCWFDVRTGACLTILEGDLSGERYILPLENGEPDYVLVIERLQK